MCPILEYATPVWHPVLTQEHIDDLERIQMKAMNIAFLYLDYISVLNECNIPTLEVHRVSLTKMRCRGCRTIMTNLPPPRTNFRNTHKAMTYPLPKTHTNCCKKILDYNLHSF